MHGGRPVIIFFHGGNFQAGSSNDWPGHILSSRGIVVVTVNYRLGVFGFLSFGDANTGNYGLQVDLLEYHLEKERSFNFI